MLDVVNVISIIIFLVCWFFIIKKLLGGKYASVKTVKATVVDKYKLNIVSKYPRMFKKENFVVVFAVENKKQTFYISEFSYNDYKIGKRGTLKYKGNKIINFQ